MVAEGATDNSSQSGIFRHSRAERVSRCASGPRNVRPWGSTRGQGATTVAPLAYLIGCERVACISRFEDLMFDAEQRRIRGARRLRC